MSNKVYCVDCKFISRPLHFPKYFCICSQAPTIDYVTYIRLCSVINKNGDCKYFERKEEKNKKSFWQKLKELNV